MARPRKYNEETKLISVSLPKSIVEYVESFAAQNNLSRTEAIILLLRSSDKEIALQIKDNIQELKRALLTLKSENEKLREKLNEIENSLNTVSIVSKHFEVPPQLKEVVLKRKTEIILSLKYLYGIAFTKELNRITEEIASNFIKQMLEQGLVIKRKDVVKHYIQQEIGNILKETKGLPPEVFSLLRTYKASLNKSPDILIYDIMKDAAAYKMDISKEDVVKALKVLGVM